MGDRTQILTCDPRAKGAWEAEITYFGQIDSDSKEDSAVIKIGRKCEPSENDPDGNVVGKDEVKGVIINGIKLENLKELKIGDTTYKLGGKFDKHTISRFSAVLRPNPMKTFSKDDSHQQGICYGYTLEIFANFKETGVFPTSIRQIPIDLCIGKSMGLYFKE